ncbi:MAG: AMP-binding protein [Rhodobacteraceae bacterium]|nr:AMP-binding protein [Paracoccaceae bacterium]
MKTSANHLAHALRANMRPDQPFICGPHPLTYGAFWQGAERLAAALEISPGDRVVMQVEKSVEALQLYVATVLAGGIIVPLNPAYTRTETLYFLEDATPSVFVTPTPEGWPVPRALTLEALLSEARSGFKPVPRGPEDLAAILYTSGTTGRSKGAMLSHRALASNAKTLQKAWHFTAEDRLIHALPVFHTHGLFVATNVVLMAGACMDFMPKFSVEAIINAMPRATALMGVPTFYTRLLKAEALSQAATNMRLFISGSAPLLASTHQEWHARTGHTILERYGMTETNMNTSNPYNGDRRAGTVGLPLAGVELRLDAAEAEIGVIEVRGDNLFSGYWNMPEKTAEELRPDGWFITGDLGQIDADGYVTIVGRGKDLIISGGFNIYPKEVEAVLDAMPQVQESAVIGLPDKDLGERVVAVIVLKSETNKDAIIESARQNIARFKCPQDVHFVDALPRNTMGKVQKNELRIRLGNMG